MVPALRQAILETKMPRRKLEDYPRELVGRRVSLQWEAGGSIEAFVAGYDERTGTCSCSVFLPHHFLLDCSMILLLLAAVMAAVVLLL